MRWKKGDLDRDGVPYYIESTQKYRVARTLTAGIPVYSAWPPPPIDKKIHTALGHCADSDTAKKICENDYENHVRQDRRNADPGR